MSRDCQNKINWNWNNKFLTHNIFKRWEGGCVSEQSKMRVSQRVGIVDPKGRWKISYSKIIHVFKTLQVLEGKKKTKQNPELSKQETTSSYKSGPSTAFVTVWTPTEVFFNTQFNMHRHFRSVTGSRMMSVRKSGGVSFSRVSQDPKWCCLLSM